MTLNTPEGKNALKWQDPPATKGRGGSLNSKWFDIIDALKARPGEWALVDVGNTGMASHLRCGKLAPGAMKKGDLEVTTRNQRTGETGKPVCDIYARYIGNGNGAA